jgi:predicted dehydrogenase
MTDGLLTLTQVGCGYWGPNLLRNFSALRDRCRVKYVAETSAERRRFVEQNYPSTAAIDDWEAALADPDVDAMVIATPAATHASFARRALECGKHVFVEKPLAMRTSDADALIAAAAVRRLTLMVGHTFLYNGAVEHLRRLVQSGELGTIYYLYAQRLNLGVIRSDLNAMWNLAPHDISIAAYVLGQWPAAVAASGTAYVQSGIEDVVFMNLKFPDNVHASLHVSWLDPNKVRRMTVVGSRRMVVYDDVADDKIAVYDKGIDRYVPEKPFDAPSVTKLVHRAGDVWLPRVDFVEPIKIEALHFLDCIRTGAPPKSDGRNGRQVVAVLEAADRSLHSGSPYVAIEHTVGAAC